MLYDLEHIKEPNGRNRLYKEKVGMNLLNGLKVRCQMSNDLIGT